MTVLTFEDCCLQGQLTFDELFQGSGVARVPHGTNPAGLRVFLVQNPARSINRPIRWSTKVLFIPDSGVFREHICTT